MSSIVLLCCPRIVCPISGLLSSCFYPSQVVVPTGLNPPVLMTPSPRFPVTHTHTQSPNVSFKGIEHMDPSSVPSPSRPLRFSSDAEAGGSAVAGNVCFSAATSRVSVTGEVWSRFSNSICVSRAGIHNRPSTQKTPNQPIEADQDWLLKLACWICSLKVHKMGRTC